MTNFNGRTNTLLYKYIISHTFFLNGWCWLCVRDELETGTDCYIDPAVLLSRLGWVARLWGIEGPKPSVCRWLSIRHLLCNWLEPSRAPDYVFVSHPPTSAVLPLIYTGASIYWRLGRGSIYNNSPWLTKAFRHCFAQLSFLECNSVIYASFTESSPQSICYIFSRHWFCCAVMFGAVCLRSCKLVILIWLSLALVKQVICRT